MFKCLLLSTGEEVISLDPGWKGRWNDLRRLSQQDELACPGCRQAVRLRVGGRKRPHFAHKHLANCPLQNESPELLEGRAMLYEWLASRLGAAAVRVEKELPGRELPRPIDCWVETPGRGIAYYLIDSRLHPQRRREIQAGLAGMAAHIFFTSNLLTPYQDPRGRSPEQDMILLTTTERDFLKTTPVDRSLAGRYAPPGGSLHYLDPPDGLLATYRGLSCAHPPQVFAGRKVQTALREVEIDPATGEPLHPGEGEPARQARVQEAEQEATYEEARRIFAGALKKRLMLSSRTTAQSAPLEAPNSRREEAASGAGFAFCMHCGQWTDDWWYFDPASGRCKCHECLQRGVA